jgi:hypothetical protein
MIRCECDVSDECSIVLLQRCKRQCLRSSFGMIRMKLEPRGIKVLAEAYFSFLQNAKLETFYDGDWWETRVVQIKDDQIKVHYVGADSDEDEWILKTSERLRPPEGAKILIEKKLSNTERMYLPANVENVNKDVGKNASEEKPVRRSRILSDDARLAYQLQKEELMAFQRKGTNSRRPNPTKTMECDVNKKQIESNKKQATVSKKRAGTGNQTENGTSKRKIKAYEDHQPKDGRSDDSQKPLSKAIVTNSTSAMDGLTGTVSFLIVPDESDSSLAIPPLKCSSMSVMEDVPVCNIKRLIADEVLPGTSTEQICIRTASGVLVGQDHSLRYVRTFLWPRCKGELVLKYSLNKLL